MRLVSLAAQKFISDIANDALQHCKMKSTGQSARKATKVRLLLTCYVHFIYIVNVVRN